MQLKYLYNMNNLIFHPAFIPGFIVKIIPLICLTLILNSSAAQNLLSSPECVSYDNAGKRYLVSCYQSGNIVQIDSNGVQSYFLTGFGNVLSNVIHGNIFYFSTITSIKGYDISVTPPQQVMNINIPSSIQLDGMVTDTCGNLYVADFDYSGPNDKIFKINLSVQSWSLFVPPGHGLGSPQDIEFDKEHNRLIVANWFGNCPIQAVNLSDSSVTNIIQNSIGNFDGTARDSSGNFYFTSWTNNKIYKYDKDFVNSPEIISAGLNGPANISYNPTGNLLIVPNFNINSLTFIQINTIGIKKIENIVPNEYRLYQNYPNPFNPKTIINFQLPMSNDVKLIIYDALGREVTTLVNEPLKPGTYEVEWNAYEFPSGVYFYRLQTESFTDTKRMVLIK
ncbi:MAG: T9SS C-terminal target domain-containing protein [Ignavibacteriae bacterium]|nr:MAG: T9SS C-terminal target domain-containing protein [Ignavibacteriota bacterium]